MRLKRLETQIMQPKIHNRHRFKRIKNRGFGYFENAIFKKTNFSGNRRRVRSVHKNGFQTTRQSHR